ncbi:MAG TPA: hypothetical protein VKT99_25595, partial [Xanthobacteraceae bacterium]|nr:hypothetical protein [Xanthobacteraceae bacterium]
RNKLFPRRLRLRIAIHESLNRNAIPLSRKILPAEHRKDGYPTWAVTIPCYFPCSQGKWYFSSALPIFERLAVKVLFLPRCPMQIRQPCRCENHDRRLAVWEMAQLMLPLSLAGQVLAGQVKADRKRETPVTAFRRFAVRGWPA